MGAFQESTSNTVWHNKKPRQERPHAQESEAIPLEPVAEETKIQEETLPAAEVTEPRRRGKPRKE